MKRISVLTFLAAVLISLGSVCAHAQQTANFNVPFNFIVLDHVVPAGTYWVGYGSATSRHIIWIRSLDARQHALVSTLDADDNGPSSPCKLVFMRYGNQYFLRDVLCSAASMNAVIPTSRMEKRARIRIAQLQQNQTTVAVLRVGEK